MTRESLDIGARKLFYNRQTAAIFLLEYSGCLCRCGLPTLSASKKGKPLKIPSNFRIW